MHFELLQAIDKPLESWMGYVAQVLRQEFSVLRAVNVDPKNSTLDGHLGLLSST